MLAGLFVAAPRLFHEPSQLAEFLLSELPKPDASADEPGQGECAEGVFVGPPLRRGCGRSRSR